MRSPNGSRFWIRKDGTGRQLLWCLIGKDEPRTTKVFIHQLHCLRPGDWVIDIGANVGYYAVMAAWHLRDYPNGIVCAFEPNPLAFSYLQDNIKLNGLTNLIICQQGLGEKAGHATLYFHSDHTGYGSLRPYLPFLVETYNISISTLDEFMAQYSDVRVGLIKADIEGAELLAFRGAERTIVQDRPVIIYEENEPACRAFGYSPADLRDFLVRAGYQLKRIERVGEGSYNVLALSK